MSPTVILAATDLTPASERPVDVACALAKALGASVHLLHVTDTGDLVSPLAVPTGMATAAARMQERVRERVRTAAAELETVRVRAERTSVPCESSLEEGRPYQVIIEEAARRGAVLVVVGAIGAGAPAGHRGTMTERLLGSTADRVVRHAPCPVLVVPSTIESVELADAQWLVGVDFSDSSLAALREAYRYATQTGGRLTVSLVETPLEAGTTPASVAAMRAVLEQKLRELATSELGGAIVNAHVTHGHPAEELCRAVETLHAAVLVVGTHGRTGLSHLVLGSTAERCLRRSPVPVLVVRPEARPAS